MKAASFVAVLTLLLGTLIENRVNAQNLVANPGFESGYFDDWSLITGGPGNDLLIVNTSHSGAQAASFAATRHIDDSIYQALPTVPGSYYLIDFWLANEYNGTQDNDFHVSWNNSEILTLTNASYFNYTEYTFAEVATGASTVIEFSGANNPAATWLDDVSVTLTTPEPGSFALAALGFVPLAAWRLRRRGRKASAR
jgi:hypothetical protein